MENKENLLVKVLWVCDATLIRVSDLNINILRKLHLEINLSVTTANYTTIYINYQEL